MGIVQNLIETMSLFLWIKWKINLRDHQYWQKKFCILVTERSPDGCTGRKFFTRLWPHLQRTPEQLATAAAASAESSD